MSTTSIPKLNLVFDATILGLGRRRPQSRGGIYRYASQLIVKLTSSQANIHVYPFSGQPHLNPAIQRELGDLTARRSHHSENASPDNNKAGKLWHQDHGRPHGLSEYASHSARFVAKSIYNQWLRSSVARHWQRKRLEALLKPAGDGPLLYHSPFLLQGFPRCIRQDHPLAVVVTVHDMLPRIHPEFFTGETIRQFDALLEQLQPSDHVICVSESTKRDFLHCHTGIPADQVHVTPLAASPDLQPVTDAAVRAALRRQLGLQPDDQVVLSLCTLEPRKNLTTLISAFEQLWRRADNSALKLVLAGSLGWKTTALTEQLRTSPAAEAIVVSGHIPDRQLACLYSLADVFVYPSVYEGFGLPPLEAMQCGTPVIVGNTSSLPEVVGDAAVLVDPLSPADLQVALAELLGSAGRRQQLSQAGQAQAACFSWSSTAQQTAAIYRSVLEGRG